jgi:hypothetical protein
MASLQEAQETGDTENLDKFSRRTVKVTKVCNIVVIFIAGTKRRMQKIAEIDGDSLRYCPLRG